MTVFPNSLHSLEHIALISMSACRPLSNPRHGMVDLTAGLDTGDMATYSCDIGFVLNGSLQRTCMTNGQWSGADPKCDQRGKLSLYDYMNV